MAALATTLTGYTDKGDTRIWRTAGHTVVKPKLVMQKRRLPVGNQTTSELTISVLQAAVGEDDMVLPSKVLFSATVRIPTGIKAGETTVADSLVIFRDVVQSTEFGDALTTFDHIKPA